MKLGVSIPTSHQGVYLPSPFASAPELTSIVRMAERFGFYSAWVLDVEAGGSDRSIYVDMPSGFWAIRSNPKFDWRYQTEPDPGLKGRRMVTPRGKALGGSSTINGHAPTIMIAEKIADAIRGLPALPATDVGFYEMPDWQTRQRPGEPKRTGFVQR